MRYLLLVLIVFFGHCLFGANVARSGTAELDQALRAWIAENIYVIKVPEKARDTLFIRQRPVRADLRTDDPDVASDARRTIANLADAFHLAYEFTPTSPNIIVATPDRISDQSGKPDGNFLRGLGLPDVVIDQLSKVANWSSGCGVHSFPDVNGRIAASIVAADKRLTPVQVRRCIVTDIINSFGLRVGGRHDAVDGVNDYMQFLLLARALVACENKSPSLAEAVSVKDAYVDCAFEQLKPKLSN
jgi:hypothetical protein